MAWVWKIETHLRIQFLIWLCLHNSLPIGEVLGSRGLNLNPIRTMCQKSNESIDHLFRGCDIAQGFWQSLKVPQSLRSSFCLFVRKWIEASCKSETTSSHLGIPWKILFPMGLWHLWLGQNNFIFRIGIMDNMVLTKCIRDSAEIFSIGTKSRLNRTKAVIPIAWERPPMGWMKLNSDGSALGNPGKQGEGILSMTIRAIR